MRAQRVLAWVVLLMVVSAGMVWAGEPCRFVVMGDNRPLWGGEDVVTPSRMYQRAIGEVNLLQPEFVIIVGDLIHGYNQDMGLIEREWEAFDEATARFEMPVHLAAGNHDIWDKASEEVYQSRYGGLWYSFEVKGCHFVVLDSEDQTAPGQIAGEQLKWLRADLAAAKGKAIFVLLHRPLWDASYRASGWEENVHPLLAEAGVDAVFAGHWHSYRQMPTRDGVRYIVTGGAGAEIGEEPLIGDFFHYVMVTAPVGGEERARLAVIRTGNVEPEDVVTEATVEALAELRGQLWFRPLVVREEGVTVQRGSVRLENPFPERVSGYVEFGEAPGLWVLPRRLDFALEARGATTVAYGVVAGPGEIARGAPYSGRIAVSGLGELEVKGQLAAKRAVECAWMPAVEVDGSLAEWGGEPQLEIGRPDQVVMRPDLWGGGEVCSAVAWLGSDSERLYVAVRVTDRSLKPWQEGAHVATGDSVELYLDGRPESELGNPAYAEGVTYLVIHPGLGGKKAYIAYQEAQFTELPGAEVASRMTAEGYEMEAAIPLRSFPGHGDLIGFDLAVNDNSDPRGRAQLMWSGSADNWEDASAFGLAMLAGK